MKIKTFIIVLFVILLFPSTGFSDSQTILTPLLANWTLTTLLTPSNDCGSGLTCTGGGTDTVTWDGTSPSNPPTPSQLMWVPKIITFEDTALGQLVEIGTIKWKNTVIFPGVETTAEFRFTIPEQEIMIQGLPNQTINSDGLEETSALLQVTNTLNSSVDPRDKIGFFNLVSGQSPSNIQDWFAQEPSTVDAEATVLASIIGFNPDPGDICGGEGQPPCPTLLSAQLSQGAEGLDQQLGFSITGFRLADPVNSTITNVPEPGTIILLGTGLLGLIALRGRKRK